MATQIRAKVALGEQAGESEVIRDGLRGSRRVTGPSSKWLRNEGVAAYDAHKADSSRGIPLDDVRAGLAERHERAAKRS